MGACPKAWRAAGYAMLTIVAIAGPMHLAAQDEPDLHARVSIVTVPTGIPGGFHESNRKVAGSGERIRVMPVDALKGDESFNEFRSYLEDALRRRDAQAVYRVVSPDFETHSMDDEEVVRLAPMEQFKRTAHLEGKDTDSNFSYWRIIGEALRFGTTSFGYARLGTVYCGPAFLTSLEDPDENDNAFVIANDVPVRESPDPTSAQSASLSWDVIQAPSWTRSDTNRGYVRIAMRDGRTGWVERRFVRQFHEPTICFGREPNGDWNIRAIDLNDD